MYISLDFSIRDLYISRLALHIQNVTYLASCNLCRKQYVGSTSMQCGNSTFINSFTFCLLVTVVGKVEVIKLRNAVTHFIEHFSWQMQLISYSSICLPTSIKRRNYVFVFCICDIFCSCVFVFVVIVFLFWVFFLF